MKYRFTVEVHRTRTIWEVARVEIEARTAQEARAMVQQDYACVRLAWMTENETESLPEYEVNGEPEP